MRHTAETAAVTKDLQMSENAYLCSAMRTQHITEAATLDERLVELSDFSEVKELTGYVVSNSAAPWDEYRESGSLVTAEAFWSFFSAFCKATGFITLEELCNSEYILKEEKKEIKAMLPPRRGFKTTTITEFASYLNDEQRVSWEKRLAKSLKAWGGRHIVRHKDGLFYIYREGIVGCAGTTLGEALDKVLQRPKLLGWFFAVPYTRILPYSQDSELVVAEIDYTRPAFVKCLF